MTTQQYCLKLLDAVEEAGRDPQLAYLVRSRLRRSLIALERGRSDECAGEGLLGEAPSEIRDLTKALAARVVWLCQPSEALDVRWKREWTDVFAGVSELRAWVRTSDSIAAN